MSRPQAQRRKKKSLDQASQPSTEQTTPSKVKLALAMIVKGSDDEADSLARCLGFVSFHVDGIFLTITQPNAEVERVAKEFGANVSHFEWCDDFAAARNFNFSQVPKEYTHILWLDADDALRGAPLLKRAIEEHPEADAFAMKYLYEFNEYKDPVVVHIKTQVVRNDGCVEWVGEIHEDFKENRQVKTLLIKDIERIHLSSAERHEANKERNLRIAKKQLELHPADPRAYWNVANALYGFANWNEAYLNYQRFLELSHSDFEKYLARLRAADCKWKLNEREKAMTEAQYALGLRPHIPDAYFQLADYYIAIKKYAEAKELITEGLKKKPPYEDTIVYNPREYDYWPLLKLVNVYVALSRYSEATLAAEQLAKIYPKDERVQNLLKTLEEPRKIEEQVLGIVSKLKDITDKEQLEREFEAIPEDLRSHPTLVSLWNATHTKTESSGRELSYFCGYTEEQWTPQTAKEKGIGGSEEAVIWLSQLFTKAGWKVTVFNNCGTKELEFDGVKYKPYWTWNVRDKQDVVVIWRNPQYLDFDINCDKIFVDMHDVIPAGEFTEARVKKTKKIFVKSKFQRDLFKQVSDEKFVIVPNGIDPAIFSERCMQCGDPVSYDYSRFSPECKTCRTINAPTTKVERDPKLVINTSAPNRGIAVLTKTWKRIRQAVPDAKLHWAYGWGTFNAGFSDHPHVLEWRDKLREEMKENGVVELGRLSHSDVAKLYLQANIWAYPSGFGEIDCISLSKAMAAGAVPITTDFAALGEKQGHGGFFFHSSLTSEDWAKPNQHDFSIVDGDTIEKMTDKIIETLQNPPPEEEREAMRRWAQETFAWDKVAKRWLDELCA